MPGNEVNTVFSRLVFNIGNEMVIPLRPAYCRMPLSRRRLMTAQLVRQLMSKRYNCEYTAVKQIPECEGVHQTMEDGKKHQYVRT